jgi:putative membrane protein
MKLSVCSASLCCVALLLAGSGCSSRQDAVETAQKENEAKNEAQPAAGEAEKKDFDSEFVTKAASGGMLEVELGKVLAAKATTSEAKQFGHQMVTDHTKANAELKAIAVKHNITLPAGLGEDHQKVYKDVTEKQGADMDKEYLKEMVKDHQADVQEFTEASVKASAPDLKAFATKTLPVLQHHLEMAQKMSAALSTK